MMLRKNEIQSVILKCEVVYINNDKFYIDAKKITLRKNPAMHEELQSTCYSKYHDRNYCNISAAVTFIQHQNLYK